MGVRTEKIMHGKITRYFSKPKAGAHKWMKNQLNRLIRREKVNEDSIAQFKRPTKGWEF